ncbi:MAG: ABC transporter permease [Dongiaceae bacterium]
MKLFLLRLLPLLLFLISWQWIVSGDDRLQFLFASPFLVAGVFIQEIFTPAIWRDISVTGLETILGLILGSTLGTITGLLLWGRGKWEAVSRPYVVGLSAIPIFALAPMLIIWFGTGLLSKVLMAAFGCFFISLSQSFTGAKLADETYGSFARSLGASPSLILRYIILPGALEWVLVGFKINVGFALLGAFIGEFVSSQAGLGHYIIAAGGIYDMPRVLLGVLLLSIFALLLNALINRLVVTAAPWLKVA